MKVRPDNRLPQKYDQATLALLLKDFATQLNLLSEGYAQAATNAVAAMPTSGSYRQGDFVKNSSPSEIGSEGAKYYVDGWKRLTNGSGHALDTDWVTARVLTGN